MPLLEAAALHLAEEFDIWREHGSLRHLHDGAWLLLLPQRERLLGTVGSARDGGTRI